MKDIKKFLDQNSRVKIWPAKAASKKEILRYIAAKFENARHYTEKEVNAIITDWHTFGDYFLIRRELIDYGFLGRTKNGSSYWKEKTDDKETETAD